MRFPKVLRIEPASSCNLRCSHCPTGTVDMKRGILTDQIFDRIYQEVKENVEAIKVVVFYHGGEPLLNKNFFHYVERIKSLGVSFVKTVSNGMMLDEGKAEQLVKSGLDSIEFSFDGESKEENNAVRIRSNFDTVKENILKLLEAKKRLGSATPSVYLTTSQFLRSSPSSHVPDEAPVPELLKVEFAEQLESGDIKDIKSTWALRWPNMRLDENTYAEWTEDSPDKNFCDHVHNTFTVRADGTFVVCCYDLTSSMPMGNILTHSIKEIWNSESYATLRKQIKDKQFPDLCTNCAVVKPRTFLIRKEPHLMKGVTVGV